jgi:hypothetical protein
MQLRLLPLAAAAAVLVVTGVVHGIRSDRWGVGEDVLAAASRLEAIPAVVGDWEGAPFEVEQRQLDVAQVVGHRGLRFVNRVSAERASLLIVCGRPGAASVHPPDICYQGLGYRMQKDPVRQAVSGGGLSAEFWTATFSRPGPLPDVLRIWWAWGVGDRWQASSNPRLSFARAPALYKVYVISRVRGTGQDAQENAGYKLIEALLPALKQSLSPSGTEQRGS